MTSTKTPLRLALAGAALLAATAGPSSAARAEPAVGAQDQFIAGSAPGLQLHLRNKRLDGAPAGDGAGRTVVLVHGASLPAETAFDVPLEGGSWADQLARRGYDVWLVNVRGYGRSGVPDAVRQAGDAGGPFARTQDAVADLSAAIEHIAAQRRVAGVHLLGWSWGTVITSAYAGARPERVRSLTLLTPPVPAQAPAQAANPPALGAWQHWTVADALKRIQSGAPDAQRELLLPAAARQAWEQVLAASQPEAARSQPVRYRSPTGVLADGREWWGAGKSFYDPAKVTAPLLVVAAQWDGLTPAAGAERLFPQFTQAWPRQLAVLPRASHFVALETGRHALFRLHAQFLEEAEAARAASAAAGQ